MHNCYRNSLKLAEAYGLASVALPNISTGVYGYPKEKAAEVALQAVKAYEASHPGSILERVLFVCFAPENYALYKAKLE